jgi:hypothetical protein
MRNKRLLIRTPLKHPLLSVLCCCLYLSVPSDFQSEDALVARVNGERIEKSAYERSRGYLEKNLTKQFAGNELKEELAKRERDVLKSLIDERVLKQRARDLGMEIETELVKSLDQVRRDNGLDNFEALERFLVAKSVDSREFKHDLELQLVKERLLRLLADRQPKRAGPGIVETSTQEEVNRRLSDPERKEKLTASESILHDYTQKLRPSSIIEVKHGFTDTGVVYTKDLNEDLLIAA